MIHTEKVKALAFDFGGALDEDLSEALWRGVAFTAYGREFQRLLCVCRTDDGALATGENLTFIA